MKSRITIEVDFENGNLPVIQILQQDSDDVRDNLIKQFLQSLHHTSRWCKITYVGNNGLMNADPKSLAAEVHRWKIAPITPPEINEEIKLMGSLVKPNPLPKMPDRRHRWDLMNDYEKMLIDCVHKIEEVGAHPLLTDAVIAVDKAKDALALYFDQESCK